VVKILNQKMWRSIGVSIPVLSTLVMWGIGMDVDTNILSTGISPGHILGIALLILSWGIYKNKI